MKLTTSVRLHYATVWLIKKVSFKKGFKLFNGWCILNMGWEFVPEGGAINEKARSPYRVLVRGPCINCIEEDERRNLAEEEDRRETRSWRYLGASLWVILYTKSRILKVIREWIGSQSVGALRRYWITSLRALFVVYGEFRTHRSRTPSADSAGPLRVILDSVGYHYLWNSDTTKKRARYIVLQPIACSACTVPSMHWHAPR